MKPCSRCAREIPDWATLCESCLEAASSAAAPDAAALASDTPAPSPAPSAPAHASPVSEPPAPRAAGGLGRRELIAIAAAVIFGAVVTFALLTAGGTSRADAAARAENSAGHPASPPARTTAFPTWSSANREWVGNQRKAVAFELPADNKVQVWQRQAHPLLVVRCMANRIDSFVFIESAAQIEPRDGNHRVSLRFDDEPESTERWPDSDEHDALFAPDGPAFADRLARARTLRFGYTPHNAPAVVASFHVSGLADSMASFARECAAKK